MGYTKGTYDFEERTLTFGKRILSMSKALPYSAAGSILIKQCVRSGTSVGANYREANDALGDQDFLFRLKIARKESKETTYWIQLLQEEYQEYAPRIEDLKKESIELTKILSAMIKNKSSKK